jgi:hypothetical protein
MASKMISSYERNRSVASEDVDIVNRVTPAAEASSPGGIEIDTDRVYHADQLNEEAFMREEMEIILMEPGNENDAQFCEVNVNGDYKMLLRNGEPHRVRRYHVAVLAQAKQSRVRQKKIVNQDGSMGFVEENVLSLVYPFSVSHDPNPKHGSPWLRKLLSNPI